MQRQVFVKIRLYNISTDQYHKNKVYLCAKFDDSSLSRSRDTIAGVEIENASLDPDHSPF